MRWRGRRQSDNIEDRRGQGGGFRLPFPMGRGRRGLGFPSARTGRRRGGGMGIFGFLLILGLMWLLGINPATILQGPSGGSGGFPFPIDRQMAPERSERSGHSQPRDVTDFRIPQGKPRSIGQQRSDEMKQFVAVVLAETEDLWHRKFRERGDRYREPKLVLFSNYTRTRCGPGMAMMGPFYCPLDQTIYIDLSFYEQLKNKFGAGGDFAQAYVIAHEVGHHVQTLLGITKKVMAAKQRVSKQQANAIQVRMELQADCLAGVWAHEVNRKRTADGRPLLEQGDIEEALRAAAAIGDDQIQRKTQGYVVEESFTHGSSQQRQRWFARGLQTGDLNQCNTFSQATL